MHLSPFAASLHNTLAPQHVCVPAPAVCLQRRGNNRCCARNSSKNSSKRSLEAELSELQHLAASQSRQHRDSSSSSEVAALLKRMASKTSRMSVR